VGWPISLPALVMLGWGMAGLLWWDKRRQVIVDALLPWAMAGMALVAVAMGLLLVSLPAQLGEQIVRAVLLIEGVYGFWALARRDTSRSGHGRG
jgi:uncharacterized membrane protein YfcA